MRGAGAKSPRTTTVIRKMSEISARKYSPVSDKDPNSCCGCSGAPLALIILAVIAIIIYVIIVGATK